LISRSRTHFWSFTEVVRKIRCEVTRKDAECVKSVREGNVIERTSTRATCLTARPRGGSKRLSGKCCQLASLDFLRSTQGINEAEFRNLFGKLPRPYRTHELAISKVELLRDQTHRELVYRPLQFHKRSQLFIGTHNETLLVVVMSVNRLMSSTVHAFKLQGA